MAEHKSDSIPANERPVSQGGLMRCCLLTIAETSTPSSIGDILSCKYETKQPNDNMIVAENGNWEWKWRNVRL